jgi:tellurite methyltransferase
VAAPDAAPPANPPSGSTPEAAPAPGSSVRFFDDQFRRQAVEGARALNPFEQRALPHLRGRVLDCGCGLGNLSLAAAERGCEVLALDASPTAIASLRASAAARGLTVDARLTDLRTHEPAPGGFDAVVAIGLLMFFDCATAARQLARLQAAVRPGGVAVVNVLVQGTTYMDMFDPAQHCLLAPDAPARAFDGWTLLHHAVEDFDAPRGLRKRFATVIARRPA